MSLSELISQQAINTRQRTEALSNKELEKIMERPFKPGSFNPDFDLEQHIANIVLTVRERLLREEINIWQPKGWQNSYSEADIKKMRKFMKMYTTNII